MSHRSFKEYLSNNFKNVTWNMKVKILKGLSRPANEDPENSETKLYGIVSYTASEVSTEYVLILFRHLYGLRPEIPEDTCQCWTILIQKC
ncbi:17530_t:CDS:2 [Gigaspora rosea]|nr:17530_t:CDS:2 [Gigaspora rosea]